MTSLESHAPPTADRVHPQGQGPTIIWSDVACGAALRLARDLLGERGGEHPVREVARPADALPDLAAFPEARMLLLCRPPVAALGDILAASTPPSIALEIWASNSQEILRLVRQRRRQVVIVDAGIALHHPDAFARRLGLAGAAETPDAPIPDAADANTDPILALLASEVLARDPAARALAEELADELEASAVELGHSGPAAGFDPDAVFSRYQAWLRENDLLVRRTDLMQEQLAHEYLQARKLEGDLAATAAKLRTATTELHGATGKLKAALASNERMRASLSYRIMAPLRQIRSMMKRKKRGQANG